MRILVVSDTHGRRERLRDVITRQGAYDALLFLGDGIRDVDEGTAGLVAVRGNCDGIFLGADLPQDRMLTLDGVKIFMTHGHAYSVKSGGERLLAHAYALGADIAVFGHTHEPLERYVPVGTSLPDGSLTERAMYLFNPGSLGAPREGKPTFGNIEIRNGRALLSHGEAER